jgi:cysteine desulfurase
LPVHQIVGMGETCRLLRVEMPQEVPRIEQLRNKLWLGIKDLPGILLNGHPQQRIASILTVSVAGVEGESLRLAVDDLAVTSGSACNSASREPSYVLRALGRSDALAEASLRFSLGRFTQSDDIEQAITAVRRGVAHLQSLSAVGV